MIIAFGSKTYKSGKDLQQKQSLVAVRYSEAITAKCSRQKPQGLAAKAIVSFFVMKAITAKDAEGRHAFLPTRDKPKNVCMGGYRVKQT